MMSVSLVSKEWWKEESLDNLAFYCAFIDSEGNFETYCEQNEYFFDSEREIAKWHMRIGSVLVRYFGKKDYEKVQEWIYERS